MNIPLHDGLLQIFDVDHGQCALLTMPCGIGRVSRMLIDCGHATNFRGAGPWYPGAHLQAMGVTFVDMLVCTNYDEDHASGFPDLEARGISVGCILGNPSVPPATIVKLKSEDGMGPGIAAVASSLDVRRRIGWKQTAPTVPGVDMTWTWNPYPRFEDENNLSLVLTLDIYGHRFMFPGDMESEGFQHLLQACPNFHPIVAGVEVLVAAHHGRRNGICNEMFTQYGCRPKLVVISDDYRRYSTQETTSYYGAEASGIYGFRNELGVRKVLTTRDDGPLTFSFRQRDCFVD